MSHRVFAITSIYENLGLLPHFLDHYTRLGVDRILIVVRTQARDASFLEAVEQSKPYPATVYWFQSHYFEDFEKSEVQRRVLGEVGVEPDDYVMHLDLDEFHEYPAPLSRIVEVMNQNEDWALRGWMVDRVAEGGLLAPIRSEPALGDQFPILCDLTETLLKAWTQKIMLCRGRVELQGGVNHDTCNAYYDRVPIGIAADYIVHHFKWTDGINARLQARLEKAAVGEIYKSECCRFLQSFQDTGRIDLDNPLLTIRWQGPLRYPS